jgi:hypothetical protein
VKFLGQVVLEIERMEVVLSWEVWNLGEGVHVDAFKFGLKETSFVGSSDIGLYSINRDIEDAYRVFDEMATKMLFMHR